MRDSRDIDAFVWDDASTSRAVHLPIAAEVVERDAALPDGTSSRRVVALAALLVAVLTGMVLTRTDGGGVFPDLLYAAAIHLGLIALVPRIDTFVLGAAVLVWCTGVELLQITGLPAVWALHIPVCRLVLGSGFDPLDLASYALGVLVVLASDRALSARRPFGDAP